MPMLERLVSHTFGVYERGKRHSACLGDKRQAACQGLDSGSADIFPLVCQGLIETHRAQPLSSWILLPSDVAAILMTKPLALYLSRRPA
ncbi:hypothetical protein CEXT_249561 [Caerostris extrusa]|uniref:Uncharacterized protein n=1 Tax=Caerostris extrusa TaxID=172846 RepID=A0AAV4UHI3_CAEEX|nr:hypothetical protein CEXT_249561 [Caerostris extrusa]